MPRSSKKAGRYPLARHVLLSLCAAVCSVGTASSCFGTANAGFKHSGDYMEARIPKALAWATACVRLWAPSLRANIYLRHNKPKRCDCATAWVRLLTPSLP